MKERKDDKIDSFSRLLGRIETEVEIYAHNIFQCPPEELTGRIGRALVRLTSHTGFDVENVSSVRSKTSTVDKRLRQVEMGDGAHRGRAQGHKKMSEKAKAHLRRLAKRRWKNMPSTQRKSTIKKMLAGRGK